MYASNNPGSWIDPLGLTALEYTVETGILRVDPEIDGVEPYTIDATSGTDECMNKTECEFDAWEGPIPRGKYYIDTTQIDNPDSAGDWERNFGDQPGSGDWGDWRARIYPYPSTKRGGRTGFYLHGGRIDGSRGCIQFKGTTGPPWNWGNDKLLNDLLADPENRVELLVK